MVRREHGPITETLDDVNWKQDIVIAGDKGLEVVGIPDAHLSLECFDGDRWHRAPLLAEVVYFPPGTIIRHTEHKPDVAEHSYERAARLRQMDV